MSFTMEPSPREVEYSPVARYFVLVLVVVLVLDSGWARCWRTRLPIENKTNFDSPTLYRPNFEDEDDEYSLPDEAQAVSCRPLKSASQARRAPQPGRWRKSGERSVSRMASNNAVRSFLTIHSTPCD